MTASRFANALRQYGHSVRIVATRAQGEDCYPLKERYIPIVTEISHAQHIVFGEPNKTVLREAFSGADIVHLFLPFKLEIVAQKVAESMRIPYMAAFHLQPEHITYNIHLERFAPLNRFIFWLFMYQHTAEKYTEQAGDHKGPAAEFLVDNSCNAGRHHKSCLEE